MPNRNNNRMGRIDEEYRKELSQIISYDLKNPNVTGMISVTKVKVTTDLKYAKVYVSILNSKNIKETMDGLKKSSGFIRSELAKRINGQIVSADSMQIYKDMNIGTAKVTKSEMQGIKHYLVDFVSPDTRYSVADYKTDAEKAIENIISKGKIPIIVGGTGLYVDSLIYGIEYPEIKFDEEYRKKLEKEAEEGLENLYNKAKEIDEQAMQKISINDRKRIIRVLEIYHATGKNKTEQEKESRKKEVKYPSKLLLKNFFIYFSNIFIRIII